MCTPYQRLNSSSCPGLTLLRTTMRWDAMSARHPSAVAGDLALVVAGQHRRDPHLEDHALRAVEQLAPGDRVGRLQAGGELVEEPLLGRVVAVHGALAADREHPAAGESAAGAGDHDRAVWVPVEALDLVPTLHGGEPEDAVLLEEAHHHAAGVAVLVGEDERALGLRTEQLPLVGLVQMRALEVLEIVDAELAHDHSSAYVARNMILVSIFTRPTLPSQGVAGLAY